MSIGWWGQINCYGTQRHQLVQDWDETSLCHTERWQVKQTALSIWLLLTSGSHCVKEVPASVLDLLAIKVQFNQNRKETWGFMLIHPCWSHVGHAGCQFFFSAISYAVGGKLVFSCKNKFLLYKWWGIMSGLLLKVTGKSLQRPPRGDIFRMAFVAWRLGDVTFLPCGIISEVFHSRLV